VGSHVFAAGQIASDYRTGVPPEARKQKGFQLSIIENVSIFAVC
jgi:hypothetical protein